MAQVSTKRIYDAAGNLTLEQKFKAKNVPEAKTAKRASKAIVPENERTAPAVPAKHKKTSNGEKIITRTVAAENKAFPAIFVISALICTAMVMLLILNFARQYEWTITVSKQQKQIASLTSQIAEVEEQIKYEISDEELLAYSTEQLGFVPKEQLSSRVIKADRQDAVTIVNGENENGGFNMLLSSLYAAIKNIFE